MVGGRVGESLIFNNYTMQIKIKTNAYETYRELKQTYNSCSSEDVENMQFLKENAGKTIFAHSKVWDDQLEVSKYENWKKYILPIECFDLTEITEDQEEETESKIEILKTFIIDHKKDVLIGLWFFILLLSVALFNIFKQEKKEEIAPPKTVLETLVEKQTLNLNKIWAKMETQKVIKSQINDLKIKLDQNITEIKALELENSTIREQMIEETSNFNTKK